jgi:hypothetical protein
MQIRVNMGGWEHECCGQAHEIDDIVTWDLYLPVAGTLEGDADYMESHHDRLAGGVTVTGRVVGVDVLRAGGGSTAITRLPSGAALRGFAEDGEVTDRLTGEALEEDLDEFVVTLDLPEGSELPTTRASSS